MKRVLPLSLIAFVLHLVWENAQAPLAVFILPDVKMVKIVRQNIVHKRHWTPGRDLV